MPYTIRQLPNEPILVVTYEEPFDCVFGFDEVKGTVTEMADGIEGPVCDIHDARQLKLNFSKVVTALASALLNPIRKGKTITIGVGTGMLFDLATRGADQRQYKAMNIALFSTLEEAIDSARKHLQDAKSIR